MTYTTQAQVRAAFWRDHEGIPGISKRKIRDYRGDGKMYNTDTRCAFCDYCDYLQKDGQISEALARRVTL
jgi:peptidoglycan/xylan/chitin deacetylase (PgdA/CDA1 family)